MWIFDEQALTNKQALKFAKEGGSDAVRHFPQATLNNPENMLHLVKNGFAYIALSYCSEELKKDLNFLKEASLYFHYIAQNEFFSLIDQSLQKNKELLDIFAAKPDDSDIKLISKMLEKTLTSSPKQL